MSFVANNRINPINGKSGSVYDISQYISPLSSARRADKNESVESVFLQVKSSHEAVYVYDGKKFLGLSLPFDLYYRRRVPGFAKIGSYTLDPPFITKEDSLYDVCKNMYTSKVYNLPVFADRKIPIGAINARSLFRGIISDKDFLNYASLVITPSKPVTIDASESVREAFALFRNSDAQLLTVTEETNKMIGILTRNDIKQVFLSPTQKQRFSKGNGSLTHLAPDEEKKFRQDLTVRTFMIKKVLSAPAETDMKIVLQKLVASDYHSLVLLSDDVPTGVVTYNDLLVTVASMNKETDVEIIWQNPSETVPSEDIITAKQFLHEFGRKITKRIPLKRIEITFKEPKYQTGQTVEFYTTLKTIPKKGTEFIANAKERNFLRSIREAAKEIKNQQERYSDMNNFPGRKHFMG